MCLSIKGNIDVNDNAMQLWGMKSGCVECDGQGGDDADAGGGGGGGKD